MRRLIFADLERWAQLPLKRRKPLLIRGARQTGKTWLIRALAEKFSDFVEINFEFEPRLAQVFEADLDPRRILRELAQAKGREIIPGKTLLFFDEIQEVPKALQSLRYFFELLPELHLVAAGSLIEFVLQQTGLPVGRVDSIQLRPLSFLEFLAALKEGPLINGLMDGALSEAGHHRALDLFREYLFVGGMPAAVADWVATRNERECRSIQQQLIAGYRSDFHKYARKHQYQYLDLLFEAIPRSIGKKFVFSHVGEGVRKRELDPCLDLLLLAGVVKKVVQTSGRTLPLAMRARPDRFKLIMGDVGLLGAMARSPLSTSLSNWSDQRALAESVVGQESLAYAAPYSPIDLYYWHREERSASAEVDYLIEGEREAIPIEVKSSDGRSLRSLRLFLEEGAPSMVGYCVSTERREDGVNIKNIPIYAISTLFQKEIRERLTSLFN